MLASDHPELHKYRLDPDAFVLDLYVGIKAVYSSLYSDKPEDTLVALKRLHEALHEGYDTEQLLQKAKQAAEKTEQQFRTACAKFVRDFFWRKNYQQVAQVSTPKVPQPYDGPMPKRP